MMVQHRIALSAGLRFRALSADVDIRTGGRTLRIPAEVLKAAADRWTGAPVKLDHDRGVLATIGRISIAQWVEPTAEKPGGVDVEIQLSEATQAGRDAAALLGEGLIRSVSSAFDFQGEEIDGVLMVRSIGSVLELSLVDEGADPHAMRLRSGGSTMNEKALVLALKALMGLDAELSNEELLGAFAKVMKGEDPTEKKPEPPPEPKPEPEMPAEEEMKAPPAEEPTRAALSADAARLLAALSQPGRLGQMSVDEGVAEIIRLTTEMVPRSSIPQVSQVKLALSEGRIAPSEVAALDRFEALDPAGLRAYLAKRAPKSTIPVGQAQARLSAEDAPAPVSDVPALHLEAAKRLGLKDPSRIAAFLPPRG